MARRKNKEVVSVNDANDESLVVAEKPNVEDIVVGAVTGGAVEDEDIVVTGIPGGLVDSPSIETSEDESTVKKSSQEAIYSDTDPIIIRENDGTDTVVYPNNNPEIELPAERRIKNITCPYCGGNIRADFTLGRLISKIRCANCGRHVPADYINRYA